MGPQVKLSFCRPPKGPDTPKTVIDIQQGAYWGTTYVLMPDGSPAKVFDSAEYEFADLNRDGLYELVAWDWREVALRCDFGMFGPGASGPKIFVEDAASGAYRQVWPVQNGPFQIKGLLTNLEGGGTIELVSLIDQQNAGSTAYGPQYLAVYRLEGEAMRLVTKAEIPSSQIAFFLEGEGSTPFGSHEDFGGVRRFWVSYSDQRGCESRPQSYEGITRFRAA